MAQGSGATGVSQATIDVVIPVYNGAATVESAIASIQAQTVRDLRIIVVNDGSTDASKAILERMASADGRIVLLNKLNGGIVDALNDGLEACTAELVARHDADDLAVPDRFERQLGWMQTHSDCSAVSGAVIHVNEAGLELGPKEVPDDPAMADALLYPQKEPYLIHPFLMVRRAAVSAAGGYRHVFHAEDTDLYWRLQERGKLANMPGLLGYYRVHGQSVTGISTLNGRISAMSSQLSGLSALRRRAGRADIAFPRGALAEYKAVGSLEGVVALGARGLEQEEAVRLAAATSAKMLELSAYRPYELDSADCAFIRRSLGRAMATMGRKNRALTIRRITGTAARLTAAGRVVEALKLCPPGLYPQFASRLALRAAAPASFRYTLRRLARRPAVVK